MSAMSKTVDAPTASANWSRVAVFGNLLIVATFGVGGGWAAVTKIDRAVVAAATVSVETNRKVVQHFEGGIVGEILVKEGGSVASGQVLLRLTKVQAQANSELLRSQLASALATEARLAAERSGAARIDWPAEMLAVKADPAMTRAMADQTGLFLERARAMQGQIELLEARIQQLRSEVAGHTRERDASQAQLGFLDKELVSLRRLKEEDLIPLNRLYGVERERVRLDGTAGRLTADIAKGEGTIGELSLQIAQVRKKFLEELAKELPEVRQRIDDLREKQTVANDVLSRVDILSPRAGSVQNLKVAAVGQVIRPGEALMEIVPKDEPFVVLAQFSPNDIDGVKQGQEVEIRFPAFHIRNLPVMMGQLQSVSNDRLIDEASKQPYFLGVIAIDRAQIPSELRARLRSGMPAEVIAASGDRTVLDYLISPLSNSVRKAFIEP